MCRRHLAVDVASWNSFQRQTHLESSSFKEKQSSSTMSVSEHPEIDGALIEERLTSLGDDSAAQLGVTVALDICDDYVPCEKSDDTDQVLKVFLRRLEGNGLTTLAAEVYLYQNEPDKLRALRNHLIDALLKPSEYQIIYMIRIQINN